LKNYRQELGKKGEELAENYLRSKGYEILEKNYRRYRGEIDLIAKDDDYLVFIEVKTARSSTFGPAIYRVDQNKKRQLGKIAMAYYQEHDLYDQDSRFDVVTVTFSGKDQEINHIKNAFWLEPPD
jgi:putative endonuclease